MTTHQIVYLVFGIVLSIALILDLGLLSKKNTIITIKAALTQTTLWVALALAFFVFLLFEGPMLSAEIVSAGPPTGKYQLAFEFLDPYLMELSFGVGPATV